MRIKREEAARETPMVDRVRMRLRAGDGRLRVGLRIAVVVVVVTIATGLASVAGMPFEPPTMYAVAGVAVAVAGVGLFVAFARRMDRREPGSYGLRIDRSWWADLGAGAAIGLVMPGIALALLLAGGWGEIIEVWSPGEAGAVWTGLVAGAVYYAAVAVWEELVFRGYLVSNAAEALAGPRPRRRAVLGAVAISIPIFAVGHVAQFSAYGVPAALSLWWWVAAGALLGLAFAYTGRLALPIGIHFTMNYGANYLVGVSGAEVTEPVATLVRIELQGPAWVVGVGGAVWLVAIASTFVALWAWLRLRPGATHVHAQIAGPDPDREVDRGIPDEPRGSEHHSEQPVPSR